MDKFIPIREYNRMKAHLSLCLIADLQSGLGIGRIARLKVYQAQSKIRSKEGKVHTAREFDITSYFHKLTRPRTSI